MARQRRAPAEGAHKSKLEVLRIGLLGGFRISVGVRTIEEDAWRFRKAASLEKLLTLAPGASPNGLEHWPVVVGKMSEMLRTEPDIPIEDLGHINAATLVLVGDDDFVPLEHTIALYRAIPNCELAVVPGTTHGHFMEKPSLVNRIVLDFLGQRSRPDDGAGTPSRGVG